MGTTGACPIAGVNHDHRARRTWWRTAVATDAAVADRGYDADKTLAYIEQEMGAIATIPPRKTRVAPRAWDYAAYKERQLFECFIGKLEHFRRAFSRFNKYARRYLAFIHLASMCLCLR